MRNLSHRSGELLIGAISRVKYSILTLSIALMAGILVVVLVMSVFKNEGHQVHRFAEEVGAYVAIVGVVLGLPALCYAMVTDDAVKRIGEELGRGTLEKVREEVAHELEAFEAELDAGQSVQVFVPNSDRTLLQPIYDPSAAGPEDGWGIKPDAPQAVTGNAFVTNRYIGLDDISPSQYSLLRLTSEQRRRYADIEAVAAAPVPGRLVNERGERDPVGVLTVFSTASTERLEDPDFKRKLEALAASLTGVLADYIPQGGPLTEARIKAAFRG
jgi:hypothetical protein